MSRKLLRVGAALVLALAAGGMGYVAGGSGTRGVSIPAQTIAAPEAGSLRVLYSLDQKRNDEELIALIESAKERIYFAIYTFTLSNIADALVEAKMRGVDVKGIVDSEQSVSSYGAPITAQLLAAGIPLFTERHASGNGIMHIKLLVTERSYAFGSYNWTRSATLENDEILEIGTDPSLRQTYETVLTTLLDAYAGNRAGTGTDAPGRAGTIDYTDAPAHIGEYASVRGTLVNAHTANSGTVFLDFCKSYKTCPFSGVIFADDAKKFGDLARYAGRTVTLSGKISSYQGRAEIILSDPSQLISQ
ncbi:TPA: hypothetical protein DIV48_00665 [Candidatus Kaiserbacteria bacterium]|nr:MAG: Phospholipase D family protein [Parcubacteria group bacterium GW2011_GWA1_56_13]KKW45781.1 MAG: Phospholipase D family protein [Parcubacteria group bacterium GW2011_GWB1_57_6]HCR52144.1 hypothetical protein [Candidatus Kaiserbacteria bacterium]